MWAKLKKYLGNLAYSLDQSANAVLGGDPNETISSRMGKKIKEGKCVACKGVCWVLNLIDKNHCLKYIEVDEKPGERSL